MLPRHIKLLPAASCVINIWKEVELPIACPFELLA